jgi:hypothetical protein
MNLTDELRKLAELRQAGHLSEQEFSDAKRRLIAEGTASSTTEERGAIDGIPEKTYQSSRWSAGNLFFPDRITLSNDGILFRKSAMFGSSEEHINYSAVASFRIKNGLFLSNVSIETSGGSQPIFVNGLWKSEAKEIQDSIRACQRGG